VKIPTPSTSAVVSFVLGLLVAGLAGFGWSHYQRQAFEARVVRANEKAAHYQLAYRSVAGAWEERAQQLLAAQDLAQQLRRTNAKLADNLAKRGAKILALEQTRTHLEAALDSSASTISQPDSGTYDVALDESVQLEGGGFIRVTGSVRVHVAGPSVQTALKVRGDFPLTVVLSRAKDGEILVHAFTGDPRLQVSRLDVQRLAEQPASGSVSGLLRGLAHELTGTDAWVNRVIGFGACAVFLK